MTQNHPNISKWDLEKKKWTDKRRRWIWKKEKQKDATRKFQNELKLIQETALGIAK